MAIPFMSAQANRVAIGGATEVPSTENYNAVTLYITFTLGVSRWLLARVHNISKCVSHAWNGNYLTTISKYVSIESPSRYTIIGILSACLSAYTQCMAFYSLFYCTLLLLGRPLVVPHPAMKPHLLCYITIYTKLSPSKIMRAFA